MTGSCKGHISGRWSFSPYVLQALFQSKVPARMCYCYPGGSTNFLPLQKQFKIQNSNSLDESHCKNLTFWAFYYCNGIKSFSLIYFCKTIIYFPWFQKLFYNNTCLEQVPGSVSLQLQTSNNLHKCVSSFKLYPFSGNNPTIVGSQSENPQINSSWLLIASSLFKFLQGFRYV